MQIEVKYIDTSSSGEIICVKNMSISIWNRIIDAIMGIEPTASIGIDNILVEWATILSIIPKLAYLRKTFELSIKYDEKTKFYMQKYKREF